MEELRNTLCKVPQEYIDLINQLFEIEKKVLNLNADSSILRNVNKLKGIIEEDLFKNSANITGLSFHNPIDEPYNETRTDCEATIIGDSVENLFIIEVIKPIIYCDYIDNDRPVKSIVQKAIVIAESSK
ncbi:hypothetical protein [Kaistella montana]|uniref:Uncharacterized protein n=1 Tax=Kaistella montana TaxID=1849733 RepID=A0ABW5K788_9FLAO|nr:hypothetical protein [Kaistella montana]MCQ4035064.1 hypothetical protein [Kaistella montana]